MSTEQRSVSTTKTATKVQVSCSAVESIITNCTHLVNAFLVLSGISLQLAEAKGAISFIHFPS